MNINLALANTVNDYPLIEKITKVSATASVRLNNDNWFTSQHPEPATFSRTESGEFYGTTTTGIPFTQVNVLNDVGIRVQKFVIQDHYHYIVAGTIVYANEDLELAIAQQVEKEKTFLVRLTKKVSSLMKN